MSKHRIHRIEVDPTDPEAVERARAEIDRRYGENSERKLRLNLVAIKRIRDIERYLEGRYGPVLPDDDAGREDLVILLNHLAQNPVDPQAKMRASIHCWALWMDHDERQNLIERISAKPRRYKAKTLGRLMRVTEEEHATWGLESIWAFTTTEADMKAKARRRRRGAAATKRRRDGVVTREEWLAASLSQTQPWKAESISRSTWERRRKAGIVSETPNDASPSPLLESSYRGHTLASRPVSPPVSPSLVAPWEAFRMKKATFYRHKKAGTLPQPIERPAGETIRASSIDLTGFNFATFGIVAVRIMRGNDVISAWEACAR